MRSIITLDVIADIILILDVAARSVLAYTEDGRLIDDLKVIRKRYFVKWRFIPLVIGALPASIFLPLYAVTNAVSHPCPLHACARLARCFVAPAPSLRAPLLAPHRARRVPGTRTRPAPGWVALFAALPARFQQ